MFKADYILCIDPADMVANLNKPDMKMMNKVQSQIKPEPMSELPDEINFSTTKKRSRQ